MKHILILLIFLTGCGALSFLSPLPAPIVPRPIQYLPGAAFQPDITNGLFSDQRSAYYSMDEGIQYLPVDILLSLKRADNSGLRVMDELLLAKPERFGLLPNYVNPQSDLPLGITVSDDLNYVPIAGIACPTCHTSLISNDKGQFFLVDGASSQFMIDRLLPEMIKSIVATLINPVEFEAFYDRYQARVGYVNPSPLQASKDLAPMVQQAFLTNDTSPIAQKLPSNSSLNDAYPTYASLATRDKMFVYLTKRFIFFLGQTKYGNAKANSKIAAGGPGRANPWSVAKNMIADKYLHAKSNEEGGPVNVPFSWDYDRQKHVFWSGTTNSMLERNLAQCVSLITNFNDKTYESTCSIRKLERVSGYASKVQPPKWPENILGAIDQNYANKGKAIFKDRCLSCHNPLLSQTSAGSADFNYVDVGTDDNYVKGQMEFINGKNIFTDMIAPFISKVKTTAAKNENISDYDLVRLEGDGRWPAEWNMPVGNKIVAKPLYGVWATPPYLHNGSVPTMWDLLQPADQRPKEFHIGGYVYDSIRLGYREDRTLPDGFNFKVDCENCIGNSNRGHEFGTDLSAEEKWNLIEFMKTYSKETVF
jgi:hypothetical protein